jgi:ABC-2 type transport system permease protein
MKIWTIAWKDTLIRFRDRNAIIMMLVAPLVIAAIIGASFGGFLTGSGGGGSSPFTNIPIIVVNEDAGPQGEQFVAVLTGGDLADLLDPAFMADLAEARAAVQAGRVRAVIHIPADFSDTMRQAFTVDGEASPSASTIQLYTDAAATFTPFIVLSVVEQIINGFNSAQISGQIISSQLVEKGPQLGPRMAEIEPRLSDVGADFEESINRRFREGNVANITLNVVALNGEEAREPINPLAFFAPSMGIFFLMFTMFSGTRSILMEEQEGTLARLQATPTSHSEILLGKIGGTFLTGLLQFGVFIVASSLIFQLSWGRSPLGLLLLTLAVVAAFTSLGTFVAAFARDITQANILGSVVVLTFAALGGNFAPAQNFPNWLQQVSLLTINRWGLDGFSTLTIQGGTVGDVLLETAVLLTMALVFFLLGLWRFQQRIAR